MNEIRLKVTGMTCGGCVASVRKAISAMDPNARAEVDLDTGKVVVHSDRAPEDFERRIESIGYGVTVLEATP